MSKKSKNKNKIKMKNNRSIESPKTKCSDKTLIAFACVLSVALVCLLIAGMVMGIVYSNRTVIVEKGDFVAPPFDSEAIEGTPEISNPKEIGYLEVYREGMAFNSFVCGEVNVVDGKADIYFTNPEKNTLWMKLRIYDEKGNVIAETGLIKPNEYIKAVEFDTIPKNGSKITMKIMTYEPDTYYSGGEVSLNTVANTDNNGCGAVISVSSVFAVVALVGMATLTVKKREN